MEYLTVDEIRERIKKTLKKINCNIDQRILPTYDLPIGDGTPCININESGYNYIISERGNEYSRKITKNIDELLYWTFKDIVFEMIQKTNKKREEWFKEEENFIKKINEDWAILLEEEHRKQLLGKKMEEKIIEDKETIYL